MAEIIQLLIDFFRVQSFASGYSNPLDQFLYAIFFPSILLVILIYLLTSKIFSEHKGLSILLGVSFYLFVIVYPPNTTSSLYAAFAPIGAFWYLVVILIGILWILLGRIIPGKIGGKGLTSSLKSGSELLFGEKTYGPRQRSLAKDRINVIDDTIKELKDAKGLSVGGEREQYDKQIAPLIEEKKLLEAKLKIKK